MSKPEWTVCRVNMGSTTGKDSVHAHFASCLKHYGATADDVVMTNETEAYTWQAPMKYHYTLVMHTYLGWKVYMLMTGCFASKPEFEDPVVDHFGDDIERIPGAETDFESFYNDGN